MITLTIDNNNTQLYGADQGLLQILDNQLKYPTDLGQQLADGIQNPMDREGWDGWVRLLKQPMRNLPHFPTGLLNYVLYTLGQYHYQFQINDVRLKPEGMMPELIDIPLRDYQKQAVNKAVREGRGVLDMPPRSGKTRTGLEIQRDLALKTIWIAPTDRIVRQTQKVFEDFFGKYYAVYLAGSSGQDEAQSAMVVVCTAATAMRLSPQFYSSRECIFIDEFHHAAAKSYKNILERCGHIYYRYGMTGTFFRSGEDTLAMHAVLSNVIYKVTSQQLLELGFLVPTYVAFVPVLDSRLRGLPSNAFHLGHGKMGIHENVWRNQAVAQCAMWLNRTGRKVLILVGTKKQGYLIRDILRAFMPKSPESTEFQTIEFVSTDVSRPVQTRILESFEQDQEVKVLIGTSLLGEGVDLPTTDALVYARGEKAEVTLTQSMYRVCTAVPGKDHAIVVDFADRHNKKLIEHSRERLQVYYNEPTFHVDVFQTLENFGTWLNKTPKNNSAAL